MIGNQQIVRGIVMVFDAVATLRGVAIATLGGESVSTLGDVGRGGGTFGPCSLVVLSLASICLHVLLQFFNNGLHLIILKSPLFFELIHS
jgi:hypothetical protein